MRLPPTKLERRLVDRITREGPITFRDFMQSALYDPELGYYNTERLKIGPTGDYYTSSNVHPAFGAVLAQSFVEMWNELRVGRGPTLVEIGAGTGQLAYDILAAMRDEHTVAFDDVGYIIVETSPSMIARQRERLRGFAERVSWRQLHEVERGSLNSIVFSNELVDAMPVHQVRRLTGVLEEQWVIVEDHRLALHWGRPSTPQLDEYLDRLDVTLIESQIIEINLDAISWLAHLASFLAAGFLVTIDYGDIARHLIARDRMSGTLRSFFRHRLVESPLERVGEQDITSSVNFTALMEYGRDAGFETVSYERQAAFLTRMGLIERLIAAHESGEPLDDLKERLAVKNLFVPGGVSDNFRVLIQKRLPGLES